MLDYSKKMIRVYAWNFWQWLNHCFLVTYPLIEECARCRDCGRNVHDYQVPDDIWHKVVGSGCGVWCYDCFCNRANEQGLNYRLGGPTKESLMQDIELAKFTCDGLVDILRAMCDYLRMAEGDRLATLRRGLEQTVKDWETESTTGILPEIWTCQSRDGEVRCERDWCWS